MKAALIVLVVLLIGSLATSGYLLLGKKNSMAVIADSQNEINNQKRKMLAAAEENIQSEKKILQLTADLQATLNNLSNSSNELASAREDLEIASKEMAAARTKTTAAVMSGVKLKEDLKTALEKVSKSEQIDQENDTLRTLNIAQRATLAKHKRELEVATEKLKLFSAAGLTPEEIQSLKRANEIKSEKLKFPFEEPLRPGKISTPILKTK